MADLKVLFLRIPEAARLLSVSRSQVYSLIERHELPATRFGTALRVPVAAIEARVQEAMEKLAGAGE